jgi:hypothetical protein
MRRKQNEYEVKNLGRVDKGVKCSVNNCKNDAIRSLSYDKAKSSGLKVTGEGKRAYLCKEHYKEFKKKTKKDKTIDKWRYNT